MLRAARNGQSAGGFALPQRPHGGRPERMKVQSTPLFKYRETEGIQDYKNVNLGAWRAATSNEINTGQLPAGASLRQVITAGGDREQRILTAASKAGKVAYSGTPDVIENADGSTSYVFSTQASGYGKSSCSTSGIPDCGSGSGRFVITPNGANSIFVTAYNGSSGQAANKYWSGYAGSATIDYRVSTPPTVSGGGSVVVTPYTPEKTTKQKYGYYVHIPASAESESKVFLVQEAGSEAQNFAFEGMDDWEENYS